MSRVDSGAHAQQRQSIAVMVTLLAVVWMMALPASSVSYAQSDDPVWARIQPTRTLRVGTAADYIPFSYRNANGQFDGYDVALISAIGEELGLRVEITDIAFDGLWGALQLGQIDVAIAALSVTPERAAVVDFTNVYYVGQDAVIAKPQSPIVINTLDDLARYRIGVQRASAYEAWLRTNLVMPGKLPAQNLFVYATTPPAVRDLLQGAVDLLVLDAAPAESYVKRGSVRLVVEGLNQQRFAMAVPKGATMLREALNGALSELQAAGRVAALAQRYLPLQAGEVQPLPTVLPSPPCIDGAALLDQTLAVLSLLPPGQAFQKEWRIRNTGTCGWSGAYYLTYAGGNDPAAQMSGSAISIQGTVAPNQEYRFVLNLVAPPTSGLYQGAWEFHNSQGASFGERLWVAIQVTDPPTPVPTPTLYGQSVLQFTADRTSIRAGECVTFAWRVENVNSVYFAALNEAVAGVGGIDQRVRCPVQTTTFGLRVVERDGSTTVRQITINVEGGQAPQIRRFTISPQGRVSLRECVTVAWEVAGAVTYVRIRRNNRILWESAPVIGTLQDCPSETGAADYLLEAQGPTGASTAHQVITVSP